MEFVPLRFGVWWEGSLARVLISAATWALFLCSQRTSLQCATEELVAEFSGLLDTAGAEALANAALGVIGKVERVVAPEGAVIVPEMVVCIVRKNADGCCR